MDTPVAPAVDGGIGTFDDHLELMFRTDHREIRRSHHVLVTREFDSKNRESFFRKQFLGAGKVGTGDDFTPWTERELKLLIAMECRDPKPKHVQVLIGMRRREFVETLHAGPTVEHWLSLPVIRDGVVLPNIFHDCAHWIALARWSLQALAEINSLDFVHLDIKADNICLPVIQPPSPLDSGEVMLRWPRLALIDYAFSIWERRSGGVNLNDLVPVLGVNETSGYQSAQLCRAIRAVAESGCTDLFKTIDWRADLYSLGFLLGCLLKRIEKGGRTGWTDERLKFGRAFAQRLLDFDRGGQANPDRSPSQPHAGLVGELDDLLAQKDLDASLARPWRIYRDPAWKCVDDTDLTPITCIAVNLRAGKETPRPVAAEGGGPWWRRRWFRVTGASIVVLATAIALVPSTPEWPVAPVPDPAASAPKAPDGAPAPEKPPPPARGVRPAAPPTVPPPPEPTPTERGTALAARLREASPDRLDAVAADLPASDPQEREVRLAAARNLLAGWQAAELGDPHRRSDLERLLWLRRSLPADARSSLLAAAAEQYTRNARIQEARPWWSSDARTDAAGRAFLGEAALLAEEGVVHAQFTLGMAYAYGKGERRNYGVSGDWISKALQGVTSDGLATSATEQGVARESLMLIQELAVQRGDGVFAVRVEPGLRHVSTFAGQWPQYLLAAIYACRLSPPRIDEARALYGKVAQGPEPMATHARALLADIGNCRFERAGAATKK